MILEILEFTIQNIVYLKGRDFCGILVSQMTKIIFPLGI